MRKGKRLPIDEMIDAHVWLRLKAPVNDALPKAPANCEEKSREVLITSLQRYAATHTADTTTSTVDIPCAALSTRNARKRL